MKHRLGLNGATLGRTGLLDDLRAAREAGYGALEIRDAKLEAYLSGGGTMSSLRDAFERTGVEPLSINALERAAPVSAEGREQVLARCRTLCKWAAELGSPYVIAVPALGRLRATPFRQGEIVAVLRDLAGVARNAGVRLGFEFIGTANSAVRTLAETRSIVEALEDETVGLVIDAFHFYTGGSTLDMLKGLDPRRLFIVHLDDAEDGPRERLTDANRLLPGDGVIPLRELVSDLEALGYRGVYSIELFRPEYWQWDPARLARTAREKMEALLKA